MEKSFVMRIGNLEGSIDNNIKRLGFTFVDKINLLGFTLQNYGDMTATNFEKINMKIDNLIRFWDRFFLSLPGKITIYKSFLIPQINYIATVMTPNQNTLLGLKKKMEQFLTKGFSLARSKMYAPVTEGGLGLFRLCDFIASLRCSWFKRSYNNINDNWKYKVSMLADGTVFNVVNDMVTTNAVGMALSNIIDSFCKFKEEYTKCGENYLTVPF